MWCLLTFAYFTIPWTSAQGQRSQRPFDNGHGWDIRLAVPGQPGNDYPTLNSIPRTSFTCSGKDPGYYADLETNCQVFRVCTIGSTYGFQSFVCPNGTLFNQEVFVCDWWMNVNCQKSKELINNKNEKFTNLKLGPQFMSDIKKMITHPIRNPYDRSNIKSNLLFMQVYKPPLGQLYNEALLRNLERNNNEILARKKQAQKSYQEPFTTDITYAASTSTAQYIPNFLVQNQISNSQQKKLTSNAHGGQSSQMRSQGVSYYNSNNLQATRSPITSNINTQLNTYNNSYNNKNKPAVFGVEFSKQRLNQNIKKEKQLYPQRATQTQYAKDTGGQLETETKQNLVSNKDTPPALITKTLAFRKIIKDSKDGTPKSRITFKTWIVRPNKSAKLTAETIPINFSNNNIKDTDEKKLKNETNSNGSNESYRYDPPKTLNNEIKSSLKEIPNYITSTTPRSISSTYSTTLTPTKETLIYLAPTTFNPLSFSYLPPNDNAKFLSRQYVLPNVANSELVAAASSPSPFLKLPLEKEGPKFSLSKQSIINTNTNNLTFSDILTKEKLDISVDDIVKDTNSILQTASPELLTQLDQNSQSIDYPIDNYLPPDSSQQSDERLTLPPPTPLPLSSRLIATPSTNLEPPIQQTPITTKITNQISNLPYIKESPLQPNTIERMVSLKITIPENVAKYLFKNRYSNDSSSIEILNTANSNYLVLTNKLSENSGTNLIPIGKLTKTDSTNISGSQDLVFSYLADSINAAKEYSNIAQENLLVPTQPTQQQFQNIQNDQLQQISQDISRLTSSQYTGNNLSVYYKNSNVVRTPTPESNLLSSTRNNNYIVAQQQQSQTLLENVQPLQNQISSDKIYSGQLYQLPVPVVTKQIYNSPVPPISNYILSGNFLPTTSYINSKQTQDQKNSNEVEIIPSQSIPTRDYQNIAINKEQVVDQGSAANFFIDNFRIPANAIRAQVQDNIVGTIPHPLEDDKLIKYKKDQSYDIYTHLSDNYNVNSYDEVNGRIRNGIDVTRETRGNSENNNYIKPSFQLIPSVGYKLEDEKAKQSILNIFQLDNFGNPRQNTYLIPQKTSNIKRRQDVSSDIDFTINHPTSSSNVHNSSYLSALYDGPSSYIAPQASVGSLVPKENYESDSKFKGNLEKFDIFDNSNGYPKIRPREKFVF